MGRALALGFRAGGIQFDQRGADAILEPMQGVVVAPARQARQQFGKRRRDQFERSRRVEAQLTVRPRRQHQERHQKPGERADGDLHHAVDRGTERHRCGAWSAPSSTITAVTVAVFRLGLTEAIRAIGATASTSNASRPASPEYGIKTAMAPP